MAWKRQITGGLKTPRKIRPYPLKAITGIRRYGRGAVRWHLLRQERPRRHARTWLYRTTPRPQLALEDRAAQNIRGSLQERIFYQALLDHGFLPVFDFDFQSSMLGGRATLGGLVADFIFPVPMVIVQIQSIWHTMTLEHETRDDDQAAILRSMGYTVLDIWPTTIEDPAALDWWFQRNIMHLWGTSTQGLQGNIGVDATGLSDLSVWQLHEIELKLEAMLRQVKTYGY